MGRSLSTRLFATAVVTALVLAGCGGGGGDGSDATFSVSGFDGIEVGDSSGSVTDAIGEPVATQELVPNPADPGQGAVWIYCDGPRPYYLVVKDDEVTEDDLQLPDELRLDVENCS
jgi:hypothetical protein